MEQTFEEEETGLLANQKKKGDQCPKSIPTKLGGFRTLPFIIANEALERVASFGLMPNMIFYLTRTYHMETASASSILQIWSATSSFMAIFGAFLSDSFLGRFRVIALGSLSSLLGMILLWVTAVTPQLKPTSCGQFNHACSSATRAQLAVLFSSFGLMSIGAGCIRPCSMAFGADQLDQKGKPNSERILQSFFNWYYISIELSSLSALTFLVYIQDRFGWTVGFGVPVVLMAFSAFSFSLGSSLYVKVKARKCLFTGFLQVLVVAYKKRKLSLLEHGDSYCYGPDSDPFTLTDHLRCLNKACVITDPERDLNQDGSASDPWSLCTVEQVESLKSILSVIPIWSTGIMTLVTLSQNTFGTLQAKSMNRHVTPKFEIPAGSFNIFTVVSMTTWIIFYDRMIVPFSGKLTGQPTGLKPKTRIGLGLSLSCAAMTVGAIVESTRRRTAIEGGAGDLPVEMSAMWLVPQYALFGVAEACNSIGQIEYFYSRFPKSMSSIAVALFALGMGVSSFVGGVLVDCVNRVTAGGGRESWLSSNLDEGRLDYYYWLISLLCLVNFVYFLFVAGHMGRLGFRKTSRV